MPDHPMQSALQPFVKLVQSNIELLSKFSASPDTLAQAGADLQTLVQQNQETMLKLMQSPALMQLAQGMLRNYTDFMTEVGQQGMTAFSQAQAAMSQQTQQAAETVTAATRRSR